MNVLDIVFCLLIVWAGYHGYRKGLIIELCTLIALAGGVFLGIKFSDLVSGFLQTTIGVETKYLPVITFSLIFLVVIVLVFWLGKRLEKVVKLVMLNLVNKLFGAAFGLAKGALLIGVVLVIMDAINERAPVLTKEYQDGSLLYDPLTNLSTTAVPALQNSDLFKDATGLVAQDSITAQWP